MMRRRLILASMVLAGVASAAPAGAELVFFESGPPLSVKWYGVQGNSLVLTLGPGGQAVCWAWVIRG